MRGVPDNTVRDHYFAVILGVTSAGDPAAYDRLQRELDQAWETGQGVREFCESVRPREIRQARERAADRDRTLTWQEAMAQLRARYVPPV